MPSHDVTPQPARLSDLGIDRMQSSRWQQIASIPDDDFENHIQDTQASGKELARSTEWSVAMNILDEFGYNGMHEKTTQEIVDLIKGPKIAIPDLLVRFRLEALRRKSESPLDCLTILRHLAVEVLSWRAITPNERLNLLVEVSDLGLELGRRTAIVEIRAAEIYAQNGDHYHAGVFFERAVESLRLDPAPQEADADLRAHFLLAAQSHYERAGHSSRASECHYKRMVFIRDQETSVGRLNPERSPLPWLRQWLLWGLWGWGERPWRIVGWAGVLMVLFALVFWATGITPSEHLSNVEKFGNCLYMSCVTFATVGYGDYRPATALGKVAAATEGLLGILFTGLFLVTFVRKYSS